MAIMMEGERTEIPSSGPCSLVGVSHPIWFGAASKCFYRDGHSMLDGGEEEFPSRATLGLLTHTDALTVAVITTDPGSS